MNSDEVAEDYGNRRYILLEYMNDYSILKRESPEIADEFSFEAYVQFAFSYYRVKDQQDFAKRLEAEVKRLAQKMSK